MELNPSDEEASAGRQGETSSLIIFLLLTYAIAWVCMFSARELSALGLRIEVLSLHFQIPYADMMLGLGGLAPGLAAIFATSISDRPQERHRLLQSAIKWRVGWVWYAFGILFPLALALTAVSLYEFFGYVVHWWPWIKIGWLAYFLTRLPFGPYWEEIGWRGFLLPRLQHKLGGLRASLVLGLIWGFWHAPLYFYVYPFPKTPYAFFALFMTQVLALSIVLTWIWNKAGNSVFVCALFHGSINATALDVIGVAIVVAGLMPFAVYVALLWAVAFGILWRQGLNLGFKPESRDAGSGSEGEVALPS